MTYNKSINSEIECRSLYKFETSEITPNLYGEAREEDVKTVRRTRPPSLKVDLNHQESS